MLEIDGETWLRTGDLVSMDEEGYFHFFDRKRDLIKYKGYSVFARHVEEVLYQASADQGRRRGRRAGSRGGQPDQGLRRPGRRGRGKISEEEIIAFCGQKLAHYKVPKIVEFRGELPKTDVGKVSRRELREEGEET